MRRYRGSRDPSDRMRYRPAREIPIEVPGADPRERVLDDGRPPESSTRTAVYDDSDSDPLPPINFRYRG